MTQKFKYILVESRWEAAGDYDDIYDKIAHDCVDLTFEEAALIEKYLIEKMPDYHLLKILESSKIRDILQQAETWHQIHEQDIIKKEKQKELRAAKRREEAQAKKEEKEKKELIKLAKKYGFEIAKDK